MGLFDKIKNFFKKNNGIEEKKDIDISNIEKNINEKKSENDLLLSQKSEKLYNEIQIILNKLESDAKIVENIEKIEFFLKINSDMIFVAKKYFRRESTTYFFDKKHILKQNFLQKFLFFQYYILTCFFSPAKT